MLPSVNDTTGQALAHDYLDDLELFFYLLCWITIGYAGPNKPLKGTSRPRVLLKWDQADASDAAAHKAMMILHLSKKVTPYFGRTFQNLLSALHRFLRPHIVFKMEQRELYHPSETSYGSGQREKAVASAHRACTMHAWCTLACTLITKV